MGEWPPVRDCDCLKGLEAGRGVQSNALFYDPPCSVAGVREVPTRQNESANLPVELELRGSTRHESRYRMP